jgi:hypothetical protein
MRKIALWLLLAVPALSQAGVVTFDFETLPDSAGCSEPVASYGQSIESDAGLAVCDFEWFIENNILGNSMPWVDTEQGLTMEIGSRLGSPIAWEGQYVCGNSLWCGAFNASFDKALDSITVDFSGIGGTDGWFGTEDFPDSTFAYSVIAFSDLARTHEVGRAIVSNLPIGQPVWTFYDAPMSLTLSGIDNFRSVSIAALGPNYRGELVNLGRIDAIHASVPEPTTWALLVAALVGVGFLRLQTSTRRGARARTSPPAP